MSLLTLQWRKPDFGVVTRWRGPDDTVPARAAATPPRPIASVIGPPGQGGADGPPVVHTQSTPSSGWIFNHNRGWRPQITVLSPGGIEVEAEIQHISDNQARIYFSDAQTGTAIAR